MSTIDTRREQMLPKLEPREIDRLRRFGEIRRFAAGEALKDFIAAARIVRDKEQCAKKKQLVAIPLARAPSR